MRPEDLTPTISLASYWDTLGWIFFKLDNRTEAEKYLNAAWTLSLNGLVADHLGQLYESQKKMKDAARMYNYALSRLRSESPQAVITRKRLESLPDSFNSLQPEGQVAGQLSSMRNRKLRIVAQGEQSAEFFLSIALDPKSSAGAIEDVQFISGSDKLKSVNNELRSVDFPFPLPPDGNPRLLRRAILGCYPLSGCSLTLLIPEDVRSVN